MGFRGAIKKGGGFLNNVDGEFKGYEFTKRFKGESKDGEWVYFVPQVHTDGADEAIDQHMFLGGADRYEVSDDGQELTMADESPVTFGFSTPFGIFMDSLLNAAEKAKVDIESELPNLEDGEPLSLASLIGRRFRFKQQVDEDGTKKFGKRVSGTGKNKKEYDRTNTVIDAVLGTSNGNGNGNGKSSTKTTKATKGNDDAIEERAIEVLKAALPVNRKNLSLPVTKALMKDKQKDAKFAEAVKAMALDEEWQGEQEWLEADKKGNLSLVED